MAQRPKISNRPTKRPSKWQTPPTPARGPGMNLQPGYQQGYQLPPSLANNIGKQFFGGESNLERFPTVVNDVDPNGGFAPTPGMSPGMTPGGGYAGGPGTGAGGNYAGGPGMSPGGFNPGLNTGTGAGPAYDDRGNPLFTGGGDFGAGAPLPGSPNFMPGQNVNSGATGPGGAGDMRARNQRRLNDALRRPKRRPGGGNFGPGLTGRPPRF